MDLGIAAVFAVLFTFLLVVIEISRAAKTSLKFAFRGPTFVFFLISCLGNIFTTVVAAVVLSGKIPDVGPPWLWLSIIGVFGFETLLQRVNVTVADVGVLTINDWITKAKDAATADAIEAEVNAKEIDAKKLADRLATLDEDVLNAHVLNILGAGKVTTLDAASAQERANAKLVKALALAKGNYVQALAISPN